MFRITTIILYIIFSGSDAKKKWSKLSYVFQSMMLFRREEVKSITDPVSIYLITIVNNIKEPNYKRNRYI